MLYRKAIDSPIHTSEEHNTLILLLLSCSGLHTFKSSADRCINLHTNSYKHLPHPCYFVLYVKLPKTFTSLSGTFLCIIITCFFKYNDNVRLCIQLHTFVQFPNECNRPITFFNIDRFR